MGEGGITKPRNWKGLTGRNHVLCAVPRAVEWIAVLRRAAEALPAVTFRVALRPAVPHHAEPHLLDLRDHVGPGVLPTPKVGGVLEEDLVEQHRACG